MINLNEVSSYSPDQGYICITGVGNPGMIKLLFFSIQKIYFSYILEFCGLKIHIDTIIIINNYSVNVLVYSFSLLPIQIFYLMPWLWVQVVHKNPALIVKCFSFAIITMNNNNTDSGGPMSGTVLSALNILIHLSFTTIYGSRFPHHPVLPNEETKAQKIRIMSGSS